MPKIFLDANILFSAAYLPSGCIAVLFDLAALGACNLITSPFALEEARRNPAKRPEGLARLETFMRQVGMVQEADPRIVVAVAELLPVKDRPILAAAIAAQATWLMTGDRQHFGKLYGVSVRGVEIVHPTEGLRRLAEDTA